MSIENDKLLEKEKTHKEKVNKLRQKQYYLTKKNKELTKKLNSTNLSDFVNEYLKGMHFQNRAALVLDLVYSEEMFRDAGKKLVWSLLGNQSSM